MAQAPGSRTALSTDLGIGMNGAGGTPSSGMDGSTARIDGPVNKPIVS